MRNLCVVTSVRAVREPLHDIKIHKRKRGSLYDEQGVVRMSSRVTI